MKNRERNRQVSRGSLWNPSNLYRNSGWECFDRCFDRYIKLSRAALELADSNNRFCDRMCDRCCDRYVEVLDNRLGLTGLNQVL